jgi:hypothetical protein
MVATEPIEPAEAEQLRSEIAALQRKLASERAARAARWRSVGAWTLTVLAVLATTIALLSIWVFRTLTDTDLFVERVGSIIEQPEVAAAVGDAAAAQLVDALDLEERLVTRLPEEFAVVAGPVSNAAQQYLSQGVATLVQTEQFDSVWDAALAAGHRVSIGVLSGRDTTAVENSNGVIVLDVTPVVNVALAEGADFVSDLLDRDITAPTVSAENVDTALAALEEQLGTDLPADFGQVVLFESENLAAAQQAYQSVRAAVWLAPIAALVLIGLAIAVSTRRLRTGLSVVIGTALLLLLVAVALEPVQSSVVGAVADAGLRGAVSSAFATILSSLRTGITVVVVLGVIAAALVFVTGRSHAAEISRGALSQTPSLASAHRGWFLGGGAVVGLVLLAAIPGRSWGQLLAVLLLYAAYALAVMLAPRPSPAPADAPAAP